jgi:hypothetical protein
MFKFPFLLIKQRLEQEVPGMKEIDWYLQQYNTNSNLYATPASYIEFLPVNPETMGGGKIQQGQVSFRIHTVSTSLHDNHKRVHNPDTAVNHLDHVDKTFAALQGWRAKVSQLDGFGHLAGTEKDYRVMNSISRKNIIPDHRINKLIVTIQEFSCLCNDIAAKLTYTHRSTLPDLKINS